MLIVNKKIKLFAYAICSRLYLSCWENFNLNGHNLIDKNFFQQILVFKFTFNELEQFYSSSVKRSSFFRVKLRLVVLLHRAVLWPWGFRKLSRYKIFQWPPNDVC